MAMFGLLLSVMVMCVMIVVDVGFFFHERQDVQKAADAAALAGAQELPDDPTAAEALALEYITKNGISTDEVEISFRCTSGVDAICNVAESRYDTIVVTPKSQAPSFFGPMLSVIGVDSCWSQGCNVQASAAGCRGACGPVGVGPVDVVMVLDHSYSMTNSNLDNAKDGVLTMFENFDFTYHRVGLAVTPPVTPQNNCDSINVWSDPSVWLPAPLTTLFQDAPHVLNNASKPVSVTNCLDRTDWPNGELQYLSGHTNVGAPIKAASDELIANGRLDVVHGIVLLTDGAANVYTPSTTQTNTGERFCSSHSPVTNNSGDNNGFQNSGGLACVDGGGNASDPNSGTGNQNSCTSGNKDRHNFWGFGADSGVTGAVDGIVVTLDAWASGSGNKLMCVQLSWNGGSSWTNAKTVVAGGSEQTLVLGSGTDNWGRTWSASNLSNSNFRLRVTNVAGNTTSTFNLDAVGVDVYYSTPVPGAARGPCEYAAQQADIAKSYEIEIFVIAWGAIDECSQDPAGSPWHNMAADVFLRGLATDEDNFFDEPKSTDLTPIFQAIGATLAGSGSRLVE